MKPERDAAFGEIEQEQTRHWVEERIGLSDGQEEPNHEMRYRNETDLITEKQNDEVRRNIDLMRRYHSLTDQEMVDYRNLGGPNNFIAHFRPNMVVGDFEKASRREKPIEDEKVAYMAEAGKLKDAIEEVGFETVKKWFQDMDELFLTTARWRNARGLSMELTHIFSPTQLIGEWAHEYENQYPEGLPLAEKRHYIDVYENVLETERKLLLALYDRGISFSLLSK